MSLPDNLLYANLAEVKYEEVNCSTNNINDTDSDCMQHFIRDKELGDASVAIDEKTITRLTNNDTRDEQPSWSPDGTKIAFASGRDSEHDGYLFYQIYSMNADGTNQTNISNNASGDSYTSWSPDGTKIAFQSHIGDNWEIYVMDY